MKQRKNPQRRCTGCREMFDKSQLLRIVRAESEDGSVSYKLDATGKANGRGAYICKNAACFANTAKSKGLERSFKAAIPPQVYESIAAELEGGRHE